MSEHCSPANYERIGAIYVPGRLIIWASGKTVNQFFKVKIKQSPLRIYPPMYDLLACSEGFVPMIYNPTPYKTFAVFERAQPKEDYVNVNTAEGRIQVPLFVVSPIPFEPALNINAARPGEASDAHTPFAAAAAPLRFPVNLSRVFESGNSEDVRIPDDLEAFKRVEATGYSSSFSFDEAFQDALSNLPPDDSGEIDKLIFVHVDSIGAEFGGIAGLHHMVVKISSIY